MKLLLTSAGIVNKSLARALRNLVKGEIRISFIPTSANIEEGDKGWLISNYNECAKLGTVDIVDISALDKKIWLPRLKKSNVIVVGGGNTAYLMSWIVKSGLIHELPRLLKTRVYVGISAGSIVTARKLSSGSDYLYGDEPKNAPAGLGYIDFNIRPHFNSPQFPKVRDKQLMVVSKKLDGDLYALDDESAVLCVDGKLQIISEGKWKKYSLSSN